MPSRRRLLALGAGSLAALAGCSALSGSDETPAPDDTAEPTATVTGTPARTVTDSPTPTVSPTPAYTVDWEVATGSTAEYEHLWATYAEDAGVVKIRGRVTTTAEVESVTVTWRVYAGDSYEALNRYTKPFLDPKPAGTEVDVSTTVDVESEAERPTRYVVVVEQREPETPRPTPTRVPSDTSTTTPSG
ncbi:hypothetical protein N0B31_17350 [Salinirubellus salinus]|uniref:Uncharacterized protein n=1 Tax=Salinirubellus salinus TaxID=1364945 RepID=A0A9E7U7S5_9EURY|nr:hypothetical protein [Salinirubellus salinus]UWM53881.1 hypothetical protein N0B31_17350 [Salinirubellus salinus]